jgi:hypothetical protein
MTATLPPTTVDVILFRAADYIIDYGWTPPGLHDSPSGCVDIHACYRTGTNPPSILGAIRRAVLDFVRWYRAAIDGDVLHAYTEDILHDYTDAVEWLNSYLLAYGPARMHASVFDWEIAKGRNGLHVITALHQAASAYRVHSAERRAA